MYANDDVIMVIMMIMIIVVTIVIRIRREDPVYASGFRW